jgi:hypothetical protein
MPTVIDRPIADVALTKLSDGRSIISTQPAMGEHPNPKLKGQIVSFANIVEILVDDGTGSGAQLFTCVHMINGEFCGKSWDTLLSAMAHTGSHRGNRPRTHYETRVLRAVAQAVHEAKETGTTRGSMERASDILNQRGFTTLRGNQWTPPMVSHIFNEHCRTIKVTHRRPQSSQSQSQLESHPEPTTQLPAGTSSTQRLVTTLSQAYELIREACNLVTDSVNETRVTREELADLRDKARKWDQLRDSLK